MICQFSLNQDAIVLGIIWITDYRSRYGGYFPTESAAKLPVLFQTISQENDFIMILLTHLPLVPHICVGELGQHWFR